MPERRQRNLRVTDEFRRLWARPLEHTPHCAGFPERVASPSPSSH